MDNKEIEKAKSYVTVEIIEYLTGAMVSRTIIKKLTGNVTAISFASGEGLPERTTPFDTYVQIIEGKAEVVIDGQHSMLETGHSIVIPAHISSYIKPNGRFKMIQTIIKSGYEESFDHY